MHILLTGNTTFKLANFREGLIRWLIAKNHQVTIVAPPDEYVDKILEMGCEFIPIKMDRNGISPIAEARLFYSIFNTFRRIAPDIVFSYTIKNNIYGGMACKFLSIPFVPNVTGLGPAFNGSGILNSTVKTLYRFAFSAAHVVFFQNTNDLDIFTHSGLVNGDRIRLLPGSGVDLKRFAYTPLPRSGKGIQFLMLSRLLYDKGVGVYTKAAKQIRKIYPNAHFQLLGPLDPSSRNGISQAQLDEWVASGEIEYLGATQDVLPFLQSCHCVILPSYYNEGTPRSLLEAGAIGRPIITTDWPGCKDVINHDITGFLCEVKSSESLATAINSFLELSPQERQTMGQAGRTKMEREYDQTIVIEAYREAMTSF